MFGPVTLSGALLAFATLGSAKVHGVSRMAHNKRALDMRADGAEFSYYAAGLGACGQTNSGSDFIVALSAASWDGGSHCGEQVTITVNGKSATATIMDECMGCHPNKLDLTEGLFRHLSGGSTDAGILHGSFRTGGGGGSNNNNNEEEERKKKEEADRRKKEEEDKRKKEEDDRRKAAEDARKKEEEDRKKAAEEEERKKSEDAARSSSSSAAAAASTTSTSSSASSSSAPTTATTSSDASAPTVAGAATVGTGSGEVVQDLNTIFVQMGNLVLSGYKA